MFIPTGGGGKGNRQQSTHQQNHNHQSQQHHQASHAHPHSHHHHPSQQQQQSRISHLHHQQQQQDQQQHPQLPQTHVFVQQQGAVPNLLHHQHLTLPPHLQQQHLQQQQQHHLQQQPIIFYPQPPQLPYANHAPHSSSSSSNGSSGGAALQLSGAASNTSLGHGQTHHHSLAHAHAQAHANGVLTPVSSSSGASLVHALNSSTLPPHFTQPAGLIAPAAGNAAGPATAYYSTAYLPFNHPGNLLNAQTVAFAPNAAAAAPTPGFYTTPAQQKHQQQQMAAGQQQAVNASSTPSPALPQPITYYHSTMPPPLPLNNNNSSGIKNNNSSTGGGVGGGNGNHRGSMRGSGQRSTTPQHQNYYATFPLPTAPPPQRHTAAAAIAPIVNARNSPLNGTPAYPIPPTFAPSTPIVPPQSLNTAPMIAATGLPAAAPTVPPTGLHTYASHLQSSNATAVGATVPSCIPTAFSTTSLSAVQQLAGIEKLKERRPHAIPIIHPDTKENVLDPNSSVFINKDSNSTSRTASECSLSRSLASGPDASSLPALILSGGMVDHQMQTEKAPQPVTDIQTDAHEPESAVQSVVTPLTDEDKVSVIVKDLLAHSDNPDLSFFQYNDVDNSSENATEQPSTGNEANMDNLAPTTSACHTDVPVVFTEPLTSNKQRPKSANKQSTATPISIANAVAEAATTSSSNSSSSSSKALCILAGIKDPSAPQQQKPLLPTPITANTARLTSDLGPASPTNMQKPKLSGQQAKCQQQRSEPQREPQPKQQQQTKEQPQSKQNQQQQQQPLQQAQQQPKQLQQPKQHIQEQQQQVKNLQHLKHAQQHSQSSQQLKQRSQPKQQQEQPQQVNSKYELPSSSSSAASTPTHQPKLQQIQPTKQTGVAKVTPAPTSGPSMSTAQPATVSSTTMSSAAVPPCKKNTRKPQKRKELEKKKQKVASNIANTSTAASSVTTVNNNNNNNNTNSSKSGATSTLKSKNNSNSGKSGAETIITYATTTKTTAAVASATLDKVAPTTTDKLSATSNNSSISFSLRDKQPNDLKQPLASNDETGSGIKYDPQDIDLCDVKAQVEVDKHVANKDIVAKFLDDSPNEAKIQLEFLNSSSSMCGDEDLIAEKCTKIDANAKPADQDVNNSNDANVDELKFGDFTEEATPDNSSFICSSTWSSSQPEDVKSPEIKLSEDNVDCAPKNSTEKIELPSKTVSPAHQPVQERVSNTKVTSAKASTTTLTRSRSVSKLIRYNFEELRELSKLSDSNKPPLVPCQKGDCISQLFVSRQLQQVQQQQQQQHQQHQQQQQQHHHGHNQHGQQYQHPHDSMDYASGKRGRNHVHNNKKHHEGNQAAMSGNSSGNSSGPGGMGSSNTRHMDIIRVQLSLKEEIKLSECENAWQPETMRRMSSYSVTEADPDDDMEVVLKKVRGILNKLTPDNFDVLLKEMSSIRMDTQAKMTNVMLLIFEKTISEPNFAPTYARFCKVLFHEIKAENKSQFTSALITRIQHEFESNVNDANAKAKKLQPTQERINACTDPAKKVELRAEMEDLEYQFRRRAWGTVRFIGELFKLQSLTSDRVLHCVESLLEHGCEEKLEYMCKLLTTVGHILEGGPSEQYQSGARIEKIFRRIHDIVQRTRSNNHSHRQHQLNIKISSRVRFMMQDVLDLRTRNWDQPVAAQSTAGNRRHKQHDEPRAQQQSQQQHSGRGGFQSQQQSQQQQQSNYQYQQQKQHHQHNYHGYDSGNYFMQKSNKSQHQENQSLSIDLNKLRFSSGNTEDTSNAKLGNSSHYQWRNASNRPVSSAPATQLTLLKRTMPTNSFTNPPYQQQQTPAGTASSTANRNNNMETTNRVESEFNEKQCQTLVSKLVEEVMSTQDWQKEVLSIWQSANAKPQTIVSIIHYVLIQYVHLAKVERQQRLACANAFSFLMRHEAFGRSIFAQAYERFGEGFADVLLDVPKGWNYVFEFLGPIIHEGCLDFKDVWQGPWVEDSNFTECFVRAFVNYFVQEFGASYTHKLWHIDNKLDRGQLFWSDARKYRDFLQSNSFQFLETKITPTTGVQRPKVTRTPAEHVERISYLLRLSSDTAIDYVNTNVHINAPFVRQLTKFLCCDFALTVITNNPSNKTTNNNNHKTNKNKQHHQLQLNVEIFKSQCTQLLRLCIDMVEAHEIACIEETVDAIQKQYRLEFDDDMAAGETICSIWIVLYDSEVISRDSFQKWLKQESGQSSAYPRHLMDKLRAFIEKI